MRRHLLSSACATVASARQARIFSAIADRNTFEKCLEDEGRSQSLTHSPATVSLSLSNSRDLVSGTGAGECLAFALGRRATEDLFVGMVAGSVFADFLLSGGASVRPSDGWRGCGESESVEARWRCFCAWMAGRATADAAVLGWCLPIAAEELPVDKTIASARSIRLCGASQKHERALRVSIVTQSIRLTF